MSHLHGFCSLSKFAPNSSWAKAGADSLHGVGNLIAAKKQNVQMQLSHNQPFLLSKPLITVEYC